MVIHLESDDDHVITIADKPIRLVYIYIYIYTYIIQVPSLDRYYLTVTVQPRYQQLAISLNVTRRLRAYSRMKIGRNRSATEEPASQVVVIEHGIWF